MSLVLLVMLGLGVWAVAYGPIEPPLSATAELAEQSDDAPGPALLPAAGTKESEGILSLTVRPDIG